MTDLVRTMLDSYVQFGISDTETVASFVLWRACCKVHAKM